MSKYTDTVAANTPKDFPNLSCGWPNEEHNLGWEDYRHNCITLIEELEEGTDVGEFLPYAEWVKDRKSEDADDLGFSHNECDLCGGLAGERYAVTALPAYPAENHDYVALRCCGDCLCYIANGDEPEDWS